MKKFLAVLLSLMFVLSVGSAVSAESEYEEVTITMLHCWNGGGAGLPDDQINNPVAQIIYENTGVHLNITSLVTSELESLNLMFASGEMPDLVNAPFWSNVSGEGLAITNAALEGLLYDITPLLETGNYPNVEKLFNVGVAEDFKYYCLDNPAFEGARYIIPQQTPTGTLESVTNWAYAVYCRSDILEALDVDPATITSAEAVYELAAKIAEGGFTDSVGNAVIPCGTLHNGNSYNCYYSSFSDGYYLTSYRLQEDGTITHAYLTDYYDDVVLFMRKMVSEGLMDVECFDQTSTTAEEKLATGKVAMFAYQPYESFLVENLYTTNPEMKYVVLGPQIMQNGEVSAQVEQVGRSGFPAMFMPATLSEEKAEAVLRVINFLNSEEGWLAAYYGVEGDTYTIEDGIPVYTDSYYERIEADSDFKRNYGMNFYNNFIGADDHAVKWENPNAEKTQAQLLKEEYEAQRKIVQIEGMKVEYLLNDWDGYDTYKDMVSTLDFGTELERAFFASSDEEALELLEGARKQYLDAGLQDLLDYLTEAYNSSELKDQFVF